MQSSFRSKNINLNQFLGPQKVCFRSKAQGATRSETVIHWCDYCRVFCVEIAMRKHTGKIGKKFFQIWRLKYELL